MSSLKLKHSGGNSVSLNPPTSAPSSSEIAFKLPNADGSANQLLKTDGSGNLGWATDQAGKILQVIQTVKTDSATNSTDSNTLWDYTAFNAAITTTGSNKVLVLVKLNAAIESGQNIFIILRKGGSDVTGSVGSSVSSRTAATSGLRSTGNSEAEEASIVFLDSPGAGTHTYNLGFKHSSGSSKTIRINRSHNDNDSYDYPRTISTFTLMEVSA